MSKASSNIHVQDNSVVERRLRPIYDWLDSGCNKKALQECDKVMKKTPNLHCAKALKALTLHRMGKMNESIAILDALTNEKPTDDATLQAMTLCYREMQELEKICRLYETAVKIDPTNEELHTHLFMSYVRISDFKAQQKCAMALYKNKPKNPYYCWAVMSIILQATRGEGANDPQKRQLLLILAERMFTKLITDNKIDAEQEVQLYLIILDLLGKYEEILAVLDGPLGEKLQCSNIPQNRLKYLNKLNKWKEINLLCKEILTESVDRWDIWKEYLNSVFELGACNKNKSLTNHDNNTDSVATETDGVDDTPEKAHEFICGIIENGTENGFHLRGPYLARFELCANLLKRNQNTTELLGDTTELFMEYFRKFGHKPCCVSDLRIYLNLLDATQKNELSTRLVKDVGISSTSVPQSEKQMQRHICSLQLSRLCGSHKNLSHDCLKALVTALCLHYQHGYQMYGSELLSTDLGPSDPYALMAVHVLYDLSQIENSSVSILMALHLLENLLKNSPSNFHAKLLAIRLYHALGGGIRAQDMYNSLDIKHLQLDSLGYIHCARLPTTGLFTLCTNLYDLTLKFFSSNYKDSSDHLTFSYKFGSFLKLDEFMDFRERLNNSLHYTMVAVDKIMLSLVECMSMDSLPSLVISSKDNKIEWESLRDNRHLLVYMTWDPEPIEAPSEHRQDVKELFEQDISFLKLRSFVVYSMGSAVDIVRSLDGTRQKHIDTLRNYLKEWKEQYETIISTSLEPIKQGLLTLPMPSRLHGAIQVPYFNVLNAFLEFLISLTGDDSEIISKHVICIEEQLSQLTKYLDENTLKKSNNLLDKRKSMEIAVNCVEVISLAFLVSLLCHEMVRPCQMKKSKKKSSPESKHKEYIVTVADKIKCEMQNFCAILDTWTDSSSSCLMSMSDLTERLDALNLKLNENIAQDIIKSYTIANKEMQIILKTKMKILSNLKG